MEDAEAVRRTALRQAIEDFRGPPPSIEDIESYIENRIPYDDITDEWCHFSQMFRTARFEDFIKMLPDYDIAPDDYKVQIVHIKQKIRYASCNDMVENIYSFHLRTFSDDDSVLMRPPYHMRMLGGEKLASILEIMLDLGDRTWPISINRDTALRDCKGIVISDDSMELNINPRNSNTLFVNLRLEGDKDWNCIDVDLTYAKEVEAKDIDLLYMKSNILYPHYMITLGRTGYNNLTVTERDSADDIMRNQAIIDSYVDDGEMVNIWVTYMLNDVIYGG